MEYYKKGISDEEAVDLAKEYLKNEGRDYSSFNYIVNGALAHNATKAKNVDNSHFEDGALRLLTKALSKLEESATPKNTVHTVYPKCYCEGCSYREMVDIIEIALSKHPKAGE